MSAKPQAVLTDDALTIPLRTTKTVTDFLELPSEMNTTGTVTQLGKFTETASLLISNSMSTITDKKVALRATNTTEIPHLIERNTQIAEISVFTPEQAKLIKQVDLAIPSLILESETDLNAYLNELLRTNQLEQQSNRFLFPTPESPGKIEDHTPNQTRILKALNEQKEKEKLNPKNETKCRKMFFEGFDWTDTLLTENEKQAIEDILVDYHDTFAGHRMDIGIKKEFKVKRTPKNDKVVYSQSLPVPMHLKGDLIVALPLMHKYGNISFTLYKSASPIFAQRKPNGKLRLLVDPRKIKTLIADDYTKNHNPASSLSDAAQHMAVKCLLSKLICSRAYQGLQMADQWSVEMLALNYASRTFTYKRLAQGLSKSVSGFLSLTREYVDPFVKAD